MPAFNLHQSLVALLDSRRVITDAAELVVYELDAALDRGTPDAVVFPHSAKEVARLVHWAAEHNVPLIARGAGTGLSGGAVAEEGGIIVEFSQMARVVEFDTAGRSVAVEPGAINLALDALVKTQGLYYPADPASGRASTLGGNVAENAGGPHCFKYGVTTNYVTGLDVILADGRAARLGGRALDYPEYDLTGLVTGSEGTLAVITRIYARLLRNPPGVKTMTAAFTTVEQAGAAVSAVIAAGLVPATMEMMDQKIMQAVEAFVPAGLPVHAGAMLIIETDGYAASLGAQMDEVTRILAAQGGTELHLAANGAERDRLWYGRKSAAGAMARLAPAYFLIDGTVPRSRLAAALDAATRICERHDLRVGYVFHAGDGNLHPFILMYPSDPAQVRRVFSAGYEIMQDVVAKEGSITGEHGVGIEKREYMLLMYSGAELAAMRDIKEVFDPQGLLNPGKIFPRELPEVIRAKGGCAIGDTFVPSTGEEAAEGLAALTRLRRPVSIGGGAPQPGRVWLDTRKLSGIVRYEPQDLYVTVGAGTRLTDLQAFLAQHGQRIAASSPWPEATVGGLVAANLNAPLRMRYGALRDQILAMTVALADGRLIRAGRAVVKNVAGYDLPKVFVGSHGTLGLIVDVTFKWMPAPRTRATLLYPVDDLALGLAWGAQALSHALVASDIVLARNPNALPLPHSTVIPNGAERREESRAWNGASSLQKAFLSNLSNIGAPFVLAYSAEGLPEDVEAELGEMRDGLRAVGAPDPVRVDAPTATTLWADLLRHAPSDAVLIRAGVAPKDLPAYVLAQKKPLGSGPWLADIANGHVYAAFPPDAGAAASLASLREPALARSGYAVVLHAPPDLALDRWGYAPDTLDLQRALKQKWDPAGILNPGEFL